jgi:hypothetical protein
MQGRMIRRSLLAWGLGRSDVKFAKRMLELLGELMCGNLGVDFCQRNAEPAYFPVSATGDYVGVH